MSQLAGRRWLRLDALNRVWRTVLQGLVVTVLSAAGDAAIQVGRAALEDAAGGRAVDWRQVAITAAYAAGTAALMAVTAYVHRTRVDPSPIPSAQPPVPPRPN